MLVLCALFVTSVAMPSLVPKPASCQTLPGVFAFASGTRIVVTAETKSTGELLSRAIRVPLTVGAAARPGTIALQIDPRLKRLGREGYRLVVHPDRVVLSSASTSGLFYATQTFRQMLPTGSSPWRAPCVEIEDKPRFEWRGAHIDVARHFMPVSWLTKFVDLLAFHKMNVLHLHLSDDQGWRMQILRYPKLTEIGSTRPDSQISDQPDQYEGKPYSGYYTQTQMRTLVAYAQSRNVTIVPEIEMPGHSQAAIASYPELGNTGKPVSVATDWGTHDEVLNVDDSTLAFYRNVLDEVMRVFPSKFIHVGGDEAPKGPWRASAAAQARMKALGLKDENELQSWFLRQMDAYLTSKGRRLIGWDEILQGGLAPGAAVMSWRGEAGGVAAAKAGHDVVMAPLAWTYLDQSQTHDPRLELPRHWGFLSLERAYRWEPVPAALTPSEAKRVLGGESALWTEVIPDSSTAEYMLFPRLSALAEVLWSPAAGRSYPEFRSRLQDVLPRLNVRYHPIDPVPAPRIGGWSAGEMTLDERSHEWDATAEIQGQGVYECTLQYFGGDNRLDISQVELLQNGVPVSVDSHAGVTGAADRANAYRVRLSTFVKGARYSIRVTARADGGTDSFGDVRLHRLEAWER